MSSGSLPPLIRPSMQLFEWEWAILQVWANNHALAARADAYRAGLEAAAKHFDDSDTMIYRSEVAAAIRAMKEHDQ